MNDRTLQVARVDHVQRRFTEMTTGEPAGVRHSSSAVNFFLRTYRILAERETGRCENPRRGVNGETSYCRR